MINFFNSYIYLLISFSLNLFTFLSVIVSIMIYKHNKKMENFPHIIDGGNDMSFKLEQKAIKYYKTKYAKIIEKLKSWFGM